MARRSSQSPEEYAKGEVQLGMKNPKAADYPLGAPGKQTHELPGCQR
jgi:hypothetical protein